MSRQGQGLMVVFGGNQRPPTDRAATTSPADRHSRDPTSAGANPIRPRRRLSTAIAWRPRPDGRCPGLRVDSVGLEAVGAGDEELGELLAVALHAGPLVGRVESLLELREALDHGFHHDGAVLWPDRAGENARLGRTQLLVHLGGEFLHESDCVVTMTRLRLRDASNQEHLRTPLGRDRPAIVGPQCTPDCSEYKGNCLIASSADKTRSVNSGAGAVHGPAAAAAVQPSSRTSTSAEPCVTIGSIAKTIPGFSRSPRPGVPWFGT